MLAKNGLEVYLKNIARDFPKALIQPMVKAGIWTYEQNRI